MGLSSFNENKGKNVPFERQPMVILYGMELLTLNLKTNILEGVDWHYMKELYINVKYSKISKHNVLNAL